MKVLHPPLSVMCKLGSLVVHVEEARKGHPFDWVAVDAILNDSELKEWMALMARAALLPVKR